MTKLPRRLTGAARKPAGNRRLPLGTVIAFFERASVLEESPMRRKLPVGIVAAACIVLMAWAIPAEAQRRVGPGSYRLRPHTRVTIGAHFGPYYGPYFYSPWFYSSFWMYPPMTLNASCTGSGRDKSTPAWRRMSTGYPDAPAEMNRT